MKYSAFAQNLQTKLRPIFFLSNHGHEDSKRFIWMHDSHQKDKRRSYSVVESYDSNALSSNYEVLKFRAFPVGAHYISLIP